MRSSAADFFSSTVKPTVLEFLAHPYDIRRGRLAAIVLNHMTDYLAMEGYVGHDRKEMNRLVEVVRENLVAKCTDFSLIQDIADATKHAKLSLPKNGVPRAVSSSEQITRSPSLVEAPFGEGVFAEAAIVFVTLSDGTEKALLPAINSVMAAIKVELKNLAALTPR